MLVTSGSAAVHGGGLMTASMAIWWVGGGDGEVVTYRWEADHQGGFATFEVLMRRFRATDGNGRPIGDLLFDGIIEEVSGTADGVDRRLFGQVAAAILRMYERGGAAPVTAHTYFFNA